MTDKVPDWTNSDWFREWEKLATEGNKKNNHVNCGYWYYDNVEHKYKHIYQ